MSRKHCIQCHVLDTTLHAPKASATFEGIIWNPQFKRRRLVFFFAAVAEEIEEGKVARELTEGFHILRPLLLVVEEGAYREARTSLHLQS